MRLNPRYPYSTYPLRCGLSPTGRYAEAVAALKEALSRNPNYLSAYNDPGCQLLGQWISQQSSDPNLGTGVGGGATSHCPQ